MQNNKRRLRLAISEDDPGVRYIYLPDHPGEGRQKVVFKQVDIREFIEYKGAHVYLDFDEQNRLIGIEVVG